MTPRNVLDHEKRRYEDDPAYTVVRWVYAAIKVAAGIALVWLLKTVGPILIEHKPLMSKVDNLSTCVQDAHDTLQHHGFVIEEHERRIENLESRRRNH